MKMARGLTPSLTGVVDDMRFFRQHGKRHYRIRLPMPADEHAAEFRSLGDHNADRRRIIVFRGVGNRFPRIPFLLFADETVEDRDDILAPIVNELMGDAALRYGITHS